MKSHNRICRQRTLRRQVAQLEDDVSGTRGAKGTDARVRHDFPRFYNLYNDPKEMYPLTKATAGHFWVRWPMAELMKEHFGSLAKEPPIKPGPPDPYVPPKR